jgi:hypothetical protein
MSTRKLVLDDIADFRAYERERNEFRKRVIELKQRRRIGIGPHITIVFENRDTVRFQIQEMARIERLYSDEQIETELTVYNPLIPEPGHLAATVFLELTTDAQLKEWLPKLVGLERSLRLVIGEGAEAESLAFVPDGAHDEQLTRSDITASVHYVHIALDREQIERFASGHTAVAVDHPEYRYSVLLGRATIDELLTDLRDDR